jgi:hypothetical protein
MAIQNNKNTKSRIITILKKTFNVTTVKLERINSKCICFTLNKNENITKLIWVKDIITIPVLCKYYQNIIDNTREKFLICTLNCESCKIEYKTEYIQECFPTMITTQYGEKSNNGNFKNQDLVMRISQGQGEMKGKNIWTGFGGKNTRRKKPKRKTRRLK